MLTAAIASAFYFFPSEAKEIIEREADKIKQTYKEKFK